MSFSVLKKEKNLKRKKLNKTQNETKVSKEDKVSLVTQRKASTYVPLQAHNSPHIFLNVFFPAILP